MSTLKQKEYFRSEFEAVLRRDLETWFPRTLDSNYGGFLADFDSRWRATGPHSKMLEFQGRQTLAAARGAARFPEIPALREAAEHGFRFLKDVMWDVEFGGWFRMLDREGRPLEAKTKHGHGSAYSISACVACYRLTSQAECLESAKAAFEWLEVHARDDSHGGYYVYYDRAGRPILDAADDPRGQDGRDCIGTPIGLKDANTTCDLIRAFADLYRVWPDPVLKTRLEELCRIVSSDCIVQPGVLHMYFRPDWTPVPDIVRYGQVLRSAHILAETGEVLRDRALTAACKSMTDAMLRVAWDGRSGGFVSAGGAFGPIYVGTECFYSKHKVWWVQADALKSLVATATAYPDRAAPYLAKAAELWTYVKSNVLDDRRGGWFAKGLDAHPDAWKGPKASDWKDCSHEVEALMDCEEMLHE